MSPSKVEINQRSKDEGETPLFFALKYIRNDLDKKLMVQTLKELGADPNIRNNNDLLAHQVYENEYFNIFKSTLIRAKLGNAFDLCNSVSSEDPSEVKEKIFDNWREFISKESLSERIIDDLPFVLSEKERILRTFESVQNTEPLDANKEYNSEDALRIELKRKQLEVVSKDILDSFQKYH